MTTRAMGATQRSTLETGKGQLGTHQQTVGAGVRHLVRPDRRPVERDFIRVSRTFGCTKILLFLLLQPKYPVIAHQTDSRLPPC